MNEVVLIALILAFLGFIVYAAWTRSREPEGNDPNIYISGEVDNKDFSRLFAKALLDERGRKLMLELMRASGKNFTSREEAILKFAMGEEDKDFLLQMIQDRKESDSTQEASILLQQITALKSIYGTEEHPA